MTIFPYETEDSFKSSYIETFQQVKTFSTQKLVDYGTNITNMYNFRFIDFRRGKSCDSSQQRRIMKELREFMQNPHEHISIFPSQNEYVYFLFKLLLQLYRYNKWKVIMCAPEHTAYKRGNIFIITVYIIT